MSDQSQPRDREVHPNRPPVLGAKKLHSGIFGLELQPLSSEARGRPMQDSIARGRQRQIPRCDRDRAHSQRRFPCWANSLIVRYPLSMMKTSVVVDQDIAREAAAILGTKTLRETIDAALREIVQAKRRLELVALLSTEGRFDFGAAEEAWGGHG